MKHFRGGSIIQMNCLWKQINDFIAVSNHGDVKSHGKLIQGEICKNGYRRIHVSHKGIDHKFFVHRLVAEAFIPNPENKPCVNHKDGNKLNNVVENLEWCSYSENEKHAYKTGLKSAKGEQNGASKLTQDDVVYIRTHYVKSSKDFGFAALGRRFGVDAKTIEHAYKGITW